MYTHIIFRPSIKAKRPPAGAKPMFPNNSTPTLQTQQPMNNVPYSYPPPPTSMYQPPPSSTNYAQQSYAPPPVQQAYGNEEHQGQEGDGKVQNMAKKFGGKVGNAAVWGFGATCKFLDRLSCFFFHICSFILYSGKSSCQCHLLKIVIIYII
jgi:hypothetical protein